MADGAPPARQRPGTGALIVGVSAAIALAGLAASDRADVAWAAAAGAAVLAIAVVVARWTAGHVALRRSSVESAASPFAAVVEAHPDPLTVVAESRGAAARVVYANTAAREILRLRQGAPLVSAVRHPRVLEALEETLTRGVPCEAVYESPGAQERVWRVLTSLLPTDDDSPQALMVFRDETDALVRERAGADFLANASHELRTPLASLTGFVETLRGHARDDPEARDRFLAIMADQADRMSRLVEDLLSLSRIELNEHVPPQGSVDLSLAATDVVDALALVARDRRVRLDLQALARGEAVVEGERDQIVQVLQNLIDNAMKFSSADGVVEIEVLSPVSADEALGAARPGAARITLLTPGRDEARAFAAVRVRDHGPGLAREHLPRLTERFYRVENRKGGDKPGTGLGLAIVKHIVNRHRGGLAVESLSGAGSVFTACFPLRAARPRTLAEAGDRHGTVA